MCHLLTTHDKILVFIFSEWKGEINPTGSSQHADQSQSTKTAANKLKVKTFLLHLATIHSIYRIKRDIILNGESCDNILVPLLSYEIGCEKSDR